MTTETRTEIAVVGTGLAGLIAATDAAAAGHGVTLFDSRNPGGRAASTEVRGFVFNQGAHALYRTGPAAAILASLGVTTGGGPPALSRGRLIRAGELYRPPVDVRSLVATRALPIRSKVALSRLLGRLRSFDASVHRSRSVAEWLADQHLPGDVAQLMATAVRTSTYTDAPEVLSADAGIAQVAMSLQGVTYLDHGWQHLVDSLVALASGAGVAIRRHTPVDSVAADGGRWVLSHGPEVTTASAVVLAGLSPPAAARLIGAEPGDLGWEGLGPPLQASCLDLGVRRPATIPLLFSMDRPLYLSTHCPPAELAPEGCGVIQLLRYLAPGEEPEATTTRAELEAFARRAGITDSDVVEARYLHRMTVANTIPMASRGGLAGRPGVTVESHPGLFVAGDWVGPVGLLADAAASSARSAARAAALWTTEVAP